MKELYKKTKWLRFYIIDRKPKTLVLRIINKDEHFIGTILWFSKWRQYVYLSPNDQSTLIFNHQCLMDISEVLTQLNKEHKQSRSSELAAKGD